MGIKHYNCDGYFSTMPNAMFEKIMEDDFYEMPVSRCSRRLLEDDAFEEIKKKAYEQVEKIKKSYANKFNGYMKYFTSNLIDGTSDEIPIDAKYEKPYIWVSMMKILTCNFILIALKPNREGMNSSDEVKDYINGIIKFGSNWRGMNFTEEVKDILEEINLPKLLGVK